MYELWIKKSIDNYEANDVWMLADLGTDKPAMNYTANNVSELKHRNVNYSQRLILPITPNNSNIFNHAEEFDTVSPAPYKKLPCKLYSNSYTLAGEGSYLTLLRVKENYECQILSGTIDLFKWLKESPMDQLDLDSYRRSDLPERNGFFYKFLAATFKQGGSTQINGINGKMCFPFIPIGPVIEKILLTKKYSFEHNLGDDLNNICTSLADIKQTEESLSTLMYWARSDGSSFKKNTKIPMKVDDEQSKKVLSMSKKKRWTFTAPYSGLIEIAFRVSGAPNVTILQKLSGKEKHITGNVPFSIDPSGRTSQSMRRTIDAGKQFSIVYEFSQNIGNYPSVSLQISYIKVNGETVPEEGIVYIAPNMGFKNQYDYFQAFLQIFGLTVLVDDKKKIVYAYTMDKLYENKSKAIDWSKKLHHGDKTSMSFTIPNYAQNNTIAFEENKDEEVTDVGSFEIKNDTLPENKELFKIKLEAGVNKLVEGQWDDSGNITSQTVANIPLFDKGYSFKGANPHLVEIQKEDPLYYAGKTYPRAEHTSAESLINRYYSTLTGKMLANAKMLEVEFRLTDEDIETFDQFTPIYIDYFGAYFYVNKIKNYISGQLTTCELIKL